MSRRGLTLVPPHHDTDTPTPGSGQGPALAVTAAGASLPPCAVAGLSALPRGRWQPRVSPSSGQRPGAGLAWERLLCSPGHLWSNQDLATEADHSHSCAGRRMRSRG